MDDRGCDGLASTCEIRLARPNDLPAIVAIYNASIAGRMATADTEPVTVESRLQWFASHDPARRPMWVAQRGGQVAGWLGLRDFYGRPAYHATAELAVYVHPDHQRRGVAAALLEHALAAAPSVGLTTLLAFAFAHNAPSIRLLHRFGFRDWGLLPDIAEMDGRVYSLQMMGLRVGAT